MEVILKGNIDTWYNGFRDVCTYCGEIVEFSGEDSSMLFRDMWIGNHYTPERIVWICGTCKQRNQLLKPKENN